MFIPLARAMSLDLAGVNSITTGSFSGSARSMFKDGNITSVPHVLVWAASLLRSSLDDAGVALAFAVLAAGLRPRRSRSARTKKLPSGHNDVAELNARNEFDLFSRGLTEAGHSFNKTFRTLSGSPDRRPYGHQRSARRCACCNTLHRHASRRA